MITNWPFYGEDEINAVSEILKSGKVNYWTGENVQKFEEEFSKWVGVKNSLSISNGSLALSASYLAIGLREGDEIITTPRTFLATSSSAVLLKAKPIFADVSEQSGCITPETIEPLISKKTKAISVVHLAGWPAEIEAICKLAKNHNLYVIEDCAQAHGAKVNKKEGGKSVGSFGDISAWSFCQDKIISTGGEGGMITSSNEKLISSVFAIRDHGKTSNSLKREKNKIGFRWVHDKFGSNFRLTEMQAAIGRIQLKNIIETRATRAKNASILIENLGDLSGITIPLPPKHITHAWYKFYCYVIPKYLKSTWSRDRIITEINNNGFPAFQGSCSEIYLEKCFSVRGLAPTKRLPIAKKLGETSLMFLIHPTITNYEMTKYAETIRSVIKKASL